MASSEGKEKEKPSPCALVVCGPSGVGKGTLITRLLKDFPEKFGLSCSHTTRKPRQGEEDGVHYHFVEKEDILKDIDDGKFLEHARVSSNVYGTSYAAVKRVIKGGRSCVLDIDTQGVEQLHEDGSIKRVCVFIMPPSFETLEQRLRGRGTESEEDIQIRLETAKRELEFGNNSDIFAFTVVNDNLEEAYLRFKEIALGAYNGIVP